MKIAIQGGPASFHHVVAKQWFGTDVDILDCQTFPTVFSALEEGAAEAGVVAIENTLHGSINEVYDLLERHTYPIVGEVHLPIHQQLITSGTLADVTHVYSHPVALAQCRDWLATHLSDAELIEYHDTADAVKLVSEDAAPHQAAIASSDAAELYNMPILAANIEDNPANFTRFLIIQPGGTMPEDADRTSLVLTTAHQPGSLAKILTILADVGVNLSKLQSRPIVGEPWKYKFYLVLDTAGRELHTTLETLRPHTESITVLGEYRHNPTD